MKASIAILYYKNVPKCEIPIYPNGTIAGLKSLIDNLPYKHYNKILFILNDNTQISPVVFSTNDYDHETFSYDFSKLNNSKIYLEKNRAYVLYVPNPGEILGDLIDDVDDVVDNEEDIIIRLNEWIKTTNYKNQLERGDIVAIFEPDDTYRNDGKYAWDGNKIIPLGEEDEGTVPEQFTFPEFPITYWKDIIENNSIIWISPEVDNLIMNQNATYGVLPQKLQSYLKLPLDEEVWYKTFIYNGNEYLVIGIFDEGLDITKEQKLNKFINENSYSYASGGLNLLDIDTEEGYENRVILKGNQ